MLDLALKKLAPTYGDRCKFVKVDAEKSYAVAKVCCYATRMC